MSKDAARALAEKSWEARGRFRHLPAARDAFVARKTKVLLAVSLRDHATEAELALLRRLRELPMRWLFQRRACGFILDFFCPRHSLAVEVDGPIHADQRDYDERRDRALAERGVLTLRFTNEEVLSDVVGVVLAIRLACTGRSRVALPHMRPTPDAERKQTSREIAVIKRTIASWNPEAEAARARDALQAELIERRQLLSDLQAYQDA